MLQALVRWSVMGFGDLLDRPVKSRLVKGCGEILGAEVAFYGEGCGAFGGGMGGKSGDGFQCGFSGCNTLTAAQMQSSDGRGFHFGVGHFGGRCAFSVVTGGHE